MSFTTLSYVLFLPLVFTLYWTIRYRTAQNILLIIASYVFYAWWDWRFCGLMLASSLIDYVAAIAIDGSERKNVRRFWMWLSVAMNLGMLGFFKYFNFFAENFVAMLNAVGLKADPVTMHIVLPAGISFYTFQTMSYTLDVYFGKMKSSRTLIDYLAYVCFFPQLVAGPIERAKELLPQFQTERRFDPVAATDGCRQILWGFFKKMVIADRLAPVVNDIFGGPGMSRLELHNGPQIVFGTVVFGYQIYCDFAAYSDIAIGTARLFGFNLSRNFAYPYFSQSFGEFWRRWHITLLTWFRDYVFQPLGGVRGTKAKVLRNVMITFILSGLWHGAAWHFIVWGALVGLTFIPEPLRLLSGKGRPPRVPLNRPCGDGLFPTWDQLRRMVYIFCMLNVCCYFFRVPDMVSGMAAIPKGVVEVFTPSSYVALWETLSSRDGSLAFGLCCLILVVEWLRRHHPHPLVFRTHPRWIRWTVYTVIVWAIVLGMPGARQQFIYFQF